MKRSVVAAILATVYLLFYCICLQFDELRTIGIALYLCSPVVVAALAITVVGDGKYKGPELGEDEFGYQDR